MADFNLGVYRPRPVGEFDSTQNYRYLDIVRYQGSTYINKNLDTNDGVSCIGILPCGQSQSSLYWLCIAEKGEKGDIADQYSPYIEVSDGNWNYANGDKIYIPDDSPDYINITNVYDGCCGIIITKKDINLPDNSLFSIDFNYIPELTDGNYYFYTFTYADIGSIRRMFIWHRSVIAHDA